MNKNINIKSLIKKVLQESKQPVNEIDKKKLTDRIKKLVPAAYTKALTPSNEYPIIEFDELTKFPEMKRTIISLMSDEYAKFIDSIDWVAPKPSTFRVNLLNSHSFYLIYTERSWICEIEGKKYYLLDLPDEQQATQAISRVLRYSSPVDKNDLGGEESEDSGGKKLGRPKGSGGGGNFGGGGESDFEGIDLDIPEIDGGDSPEIDLPGDDDIEDIDSIEDEE